MPLCPENIYLPLYWRLSLKERICSQTKQIYSIKMTLVILKISDVLEATFCLKICLLDK